MAEAVEKNNEGKEDEFSGKKNRWVGPVIIIVSLLLVAATAVGVVISLKKAAAKRANWKGFGGMGGNQMEVSVRSLTAEITTLNDYVVTNGEIRASSQVSVLPDMAGKLVSVKVALGDKVRRGQLIAYVDPSMPGTVFANSPVYSPISGTVIQTPIAAGTKVSTASVITIVGQTDELQVTANISEKYVAALKKGLKAEISLEAYPGEIFAATVTHVSPVLDATSRTKEVTLSFDEKDERINAGMFAKLKLYTFEYEGCVTVPASAIVIKNDRQHLWVIDPESKAVSLRAVSTGKSVDGIVQVIEGIEPGEKMVVQGMRNLSEGAHVIEVISAGENNAQ